MNALETAVQKQGGQTALARVLGLKQGHIWYWLNKSGGEVPAEYCPAIERATGVRCEDLRPDVDWSVLRCPKKVSLSSS